jgi:hypothetical protein
MRVILTLAVLPFALLMSSATASASEIYPGRIQERLGTECVPSCTLCHDTNKGGVNTVHKPFGLAMRGNGLGAGNLTQLDAALAKMATDATNSDGAAEPTPDIQEMINGDDPNRLGGELCIGPKYGCGAAATAASALLLTFGLLLVRRRRGQ